MAEPGIRLEVFVPWPEEVVRGVAEVEGGCGNEVRIRPKACGLAAVTTGMTKLPMRMV